MDDKTRIDRDRPHRPFGGHSYARSQLDRSGALIVRWVYQRLLAHLLVNIEMTLPSSIIAGRTFNLTVQCATDLVGLHDCASQYQIHFRGPIAYTVPAAKAIYHHNATSGTTVIECQLSQSGLYEIWAWPDWPNVNSCPSGKNQYQMGAVKGSGTMTLTVGEGARPNVDSMRPCARDDYGSTMDGRWVGVDYIREEYRQLPILQSQLERSSEFQDHPRVTIC